MAKISINQFGGVAPKIPARYLPDGAAQQALNMGSNGTSLQPYPGVGNSVHTLPHTGTIETIFKYGNTSSDDAYWMAWNAKTYVATGQIANDPNSWIFYTQEGSTIGPRATYRTVALGNAPTANGAYPLQDVPLGMPDATEADEPTATKGAEPALEGDLNELFISSTQLSNMNTVNGTLTFKTGSDPDSLTALGTVTITATDAVSVAAALETIDPSITANALDGGVYLTYGTDPAVYVALEYIIGSQADTTQTFTVGSYDSGTVSGSLSSSSTIHITPQERASYTNQYVQVKGSAPSSATYDYWGQNVPVVGSITATATSFANTLNALFAVVSPAHWEATARDDDVYVGPTASNTTVGNFLEISVYKETTATHTFGGPVLRVPMNYLHQTNSSGVLFAETHLGKQTAMATLGYNTGLRDGSKSQVPGFTSKTRKKYTQDIGGHWNAAFAEDFKNAFGGRWSFAWRKVNANTQEVLIYRAYDSQTWDEDDELTLYFEPSSVYTEESDDVTYSYRFLSNTVNTVQSLSTSTLQAAEVAGDAIFLLPETGGNATVDTLKDQEVRIATKEGEATKLRYQGAAPTLDTLISEVSGVLSGLSSNWSVDKLVDATYGNYLRVTWTGASPPTNDDFFSFIIAGVSADTVDKFSRIGSGAGYPEIILSGAETVDLFAEFDITYAKVTINGGDPKYVEVNNLQEASLICSSGDPVESVVIDAYKEFLGRCADAEGLAYWSDDVADKWPSYSAAADYDDVKAYLRDLMYTSPEWVDIRNAIANKLRTVNVNAEVSGDGLRIWLSSGGATVNLRVQNGRYTTGGGSEATTNLIVTVRPQLVEDFGALESRVYVFTWVSTIANYEFESAPSKVSNVVDVYVNQDVEVSALPTSTHKSVSGYSVTGKRLYRAVNGVYLFVKEIGKDTVTVTDDLRAEELGEELPSLLWNPPPDRLAGLISLPNGFMAGFVGHDIYFSEPYRPHAWPETYVQTVDYPVVGLGRMDTTLVVLTKGTPYFIQGTSPDTMSVVKSDIEQSCISRDSIVSINGAVIYASPDGLVSLSSSGSSIVSQQIMSKEQWQGLYPSLIHAYSYDNKYIAFIDGIDNINTTQAKFLQDSFGGLFTVAVGQNETEDKIIVLYKQYWGRGPYATELSADYADIDAGNLTLADLETSLSTTPPFLSQDAGNLPKQIGFTFDLVSGQYVFHRIPSAADGSERYVVTAYSDLTTDNLYVLLNDGKVYKWGSDVSPQGLMPYSWTSKRFTFDRPMAFSCANVDAEGYPLQVDIYANGRLMHTQQVTSRESFRLPAGYVARDWEISVSGSTEVFAIQIAQSVAELANG